MDYLQVEASDAPSLFGGTSSDQPHTLHIGIPYVDRMVPNFIGRRSERSVECPRPLPRLREKRQAGSSLARAAVAGTDGSVGSALGTHQAMESPDTVANLGVQKPSPHPR